MTDETGEQSAGGSAVAKIKVTVADILQRTRYPFTGLEKRVKNVTFTDIQIPACDFKKGPK